MLPFLSGYTLCRTVSDWRECLEASSEPHVTERAEDYETCPPPELLHHKASALRPEQGAIICGISLAWRDATGFLRSCYVGFRHDPRYTDFEQPDAEECLALWRENCRNLPRKVLRVAHNGISLERGLDLREKVPWPLPGQDRDTMVAYRILDRGIGPKQRLGLKGLRDHYLKDRGYHLVKNELDDWLELHGFKRGADIWRSPVPLAGEYGAGDTCSTLELWEACKAEVHRPWQYADEFGWWWHRGHFDISGTNGPPLADYYDLEMEAATQSLIASAYGTRFNAALAAKRAEGARRLQAACDAWIVNKIVGMQDALGPLGWVADKKSEDPGVLTPEHKLNPGSAEQMKRLLFGDGKANVGLGLEISTQFMSKKFEDMGAREQTEKLEDPVKKRQYAALSIPAMKHYTEQYPEHADLLLMIGARRKMTTVLQWSSGVPGRWLIKGVDQAWWRETDGKRPTHRIYHQIGTVKTTSGRMSSSDYNGQNVSADKALQVSRRVLRCLDDIYPDSLIGPLLRRIDALEDEQAKFKDTRHAPEISKLLKEVAQIHRDKAFESELLRLMRGLPVTSKCSLDFGVRAYFLPDEGCTGRPIDLSQIEVRIFAGLTGNKMLCAGYGKPPTEQQVADELAMLLAIGRGELSIEEYEARTTMDVGRHWRGTPIDAHSLVTDMTTQDRELGPMRLERKDYSDILQLCAGDEERGVLRVLQAWGVWNGDARALTREEMHSVLAAMDAAERGDAEALIKELVKARKSKKSITFGIMYGMGVTKLARSLGISFDAAKEFIDNRYFAAFPEARELPRTIEDAIVARGKVERDKVGWMRNPSGRKFHFKLEWKHKPWAKTCPTGAMGKPYDASVRPCRDCYLSAKGAYVAVNRFIQGYAAAIFKMGWVRTGQLLTMKAWGGGKIDPITRRSYGPCRLDRAIHDELVPMIAYEYDDAKTDYCIRSGMTLATRVGVPLESSSERYRGNWGEKEDVKYTKLSDR